MPPRITSSDWVSARSVSGFLSAARLRVRYCVTKKVSPSEGMRETRKKRASRRPRSVPIISRRCSAASAEPAFHFARQLAAGRADLDALAVPHRHRGDAGRQVVDEALNPLGGRSAKAARADRIVGNQIDAAGELPHQADELRRVTDRVVDLLDQNVLERDTLADLLDVDPHRPHERIEGE